eukprot:TRINITY_DN2293_c0_g1_i1.p1 TRINITY_DN2293_c0_g1~~TRINITY_DN2293_c0_g1_i1.p1  ORF type:complete len:406 (-),score=106.61 TRINITY_DN2293_c0_g1_i1:59-1276(-)
MAVSAAYAKLAPAELAALTSLKQRCAAAIATDPERYDDMYLMRYLRWRDFNVDVLVPQFNKHAEWVQSYGIKGIVEEMKTSKDPSIVFLRSYWPITISYGLDKRGFSYGTVRYGVIDVAGLEKKIDISLVPRYFIAVYEEGLQLFIKEVKAAAVRTGDPTLPLSPIGLFFVTDLAELGWHHLHKKTLDAFGEAMELAKSGYPELLQWNPIINAPAVFTVFWSIFKPILGKKSVEKIQIFGTNAAEWQARLREVIPVDQLPQEWGGTNPKPLPKGGLINEDNLARTLVVSSSHEVAVDAGAGAWIAFQFKTEAHDIGFGVVFGAARELVIPLARYDCAGEYACGHFQAPRAGRYTVLFDNSFSLLRSKKVTYQIAVHEAGAWAHEVAAQHGGDTLAATAVSLSKRE